MRWAVYVACIKKKRKMHTGRGFVGKRERDNVEALHTDGR
jgi:hypothetical protein